MKNGQPIHEWAKAFGPQTRLYASCFPVQNLKWYPLGHSRKMKITRFRTEKRLRLPLQVVPPSVGVAEFSGHSKPRLLLISMKGDEQFKSIRCARLQFAQGAIIMIIVDCRCHRHHGRASATALPPCAPSFVLRVKQDWKKSSLH